ncbi:glycoside hydrolase family 5 protein [Crepidotus variabilis]|uniref:Glycoside hydrolase family 5 protein n=1 Tax=Crepidotus variabilis TaxID=179855 RepID=A0A9P6EPI6_9AGAR|nr:glycoside hydrolase family 5 protein [Crepidotus variabilis]
MWSSAIFGSFARALIVALLLHIAPTDARQKCSLKARDQAVLHPVDHGPVPSPTSSTIIGTATVTFNGKPSASPIYNYSPYRYGMDKIRGVNIGGWLVLEPWITPSLFDATGNDKIIDEFTLGQYLDPGKAQTLLQQHWSTWITEDDFVQIAAAGLNHVRIPIGYWSIPLTSSDTKESTDSSPYVTGAWDFLLRAVSWANNHGLQVIIDLHGAPGSQNGYDNSGELTNNPVWAVNQGNISRTVDTIKFLAKTFGSDVGMIELLNEAAGFRGDDWANAVRQYWLDGYAAVRASGGQDVQVMIGEAFMGFDAWKNFLSYPGAQGVFMDYHEYQIFSHPELSRSYDDHINFACTYKPTLSTFSVTSLYTILGEWSNAITDCAKWLNGRWVGSRWDNTWYPSSDTQYHGSCDGYTGSYQGWSDSYKQFLRKYFEVQVEVGEAGQGWVFWTWKTESADEWSYQKGLEGGWIPQNPTDRRYPNICK